MQSTFKAFPIDELIDAMVPIYQRHFTHADLVGVIEFYSSATGQKYLKEMPAMMSESMQGMQPGTEILGMRGLVVMCGRGLVKDKLPSLAVLHPH
jgi:Uncharacterized protein conserved in bacteria (DUF2059)